MRKRALRQGKGVKIILVSLKTYRNMDLKERFYLLLGR